ncbi:transposase [Paenibacillus larvae]|nr:transposase [Paenibacillus larvae]MDT2242170.1 transposase [Paenibacillus larvae]
MGYIRGWEPLHKCSAHCGGKFTTELFSRYQRSEQALILAMMEMVVNGVSTRKTRK